MHNNSVLAALLSTGFLANPALAQQPQWQLEQTSTSSSPSRQGGTVFDHLRDRVVMLTSTALQSPASEHWEFDGQVWRRYTAYPAALASRTAFGMAYDGRRARLVQFGGLGTSGLSSETWVLNGSSWHQTTPATSPPARAGHGMTYDEARDRVVLVGGQAIGFYFFALNDVWEFDGVDWQPRAPLPQARSFPAITYDSHRARTIVYGGGYMTSGSWGPNNHYYDALQWDGVSWQTLPSAGPVPALHGSLCYDRERDRCVLVGRTPNVGARELWEYDGATWIRDSVAPPNIGGTTYDRQRGRLVVAAPDASYSGTEVWARSWPGLAVAQPYGAGCGSPAMGCRVDAAARPVLGATFGVDIEAVPNGIAFMCFGWSNQDVLGLTLPAPMDVFGLPGCWLLQSDDAITLPCQMTGPTTARFTFALPAHPSFSGLRFFLQPWGPAPGLNPGGGAVGDAVAVTIGAF